MQEQQLFHANTLLDTLQFILCSADKISDTPFQLNLEEFLGICSIDWEASQW